MLKIVAIMVGGILVGRIFRKHDLKFIPLLITVLIWALLFLLGVEVGNDKHIASGLSGLGAEALLLSLAGAGGSALLAAWLWHRIGGKS